MDRLKNRIGFWAGIAGSICVFLWPLPWPDSAQAAAAVAVLMIVWWATEALPVGATALLPLALYPSFSIMSMDQISRQYGDPHIFLFMGGFMLALAMEKSGLHKRIALHLIRIMGYGHRQILAGFMIASAFMSLWISNTAATMMVLPIGLAVIQQFQAHKGKFASALMLGIAYASSIGGVATLIGKPTNMIFVGQARNLLPELKEISFIEWSLIGFPIAAGFLLIVWFCLALFIGNNRKVNQLDELIAKDLHDLGRMTKAEWRVIFVTLLAVMGWFFKSDIILGGDNVIPGWATLLGVQGLHDATIAMVAALALFVIPAGDGKSGDRLLDWDWVRRMPWDILLLLGAGFGLAASFHASGLDMIIAGAFSSLVNIPHFLIILAVCLATVFLSELISNTALVAMLVPILAPIAKAWGIHPYLLMFPATIAASFAFMMPVGTPPNAIAYSSGHVRIHHMMGIGFILNILGALWISALAPVLIKCLYEG